MESIAIAPSAKWRTGDSPNTNAAICLAESVLDDPITLGATTSHSQTTICYRVFPALLSRMGDCDLETNCALIVTEK